MTKHKIASSSQRSDRHLSPQQPLIPSPVLQNPTPTLQAQKAESLLSEWQPTARYDLDSPDPLASLYCSSPQAQIQRQDLDPSEWQPTTRYDLDSPNPLASLYGSISDPATSTQPQTSSPESSSAPPQVGTIQRSETHAPPTASIESVDDLQEVSTPEVTLEPTITHLQAPPTIQRAQDWWFKYQVLSDKYTDPSAVLTLFKQWLKDNKNINFNDFSVSRADAEAHLKEFYDDQPPDKKVMEWDWQDSRFANCYAYAVGDKTPEFTPGKATAKPGGSKGQAANPGEDPQEYTAALLTGAELDGLIPIRKALGDVAQYAPPNNPPPSNPPGDYKDHRLVALINSNTGFHWYRRNPNNIWTWKDGNGGKVTNAAFIDKKLTVMTDAVAGQVFADPEQRLGFANMTFSGYFYAPPHIKVGDT